MKANDRFEPSELNIAHKTQQQASELGFDWDNPWPVFDKVTEELNELQEACLHKTPEDQEEELGDLLFSVVNLARHLNICPDKSLAGATEKFHKRFTKVKDSAAE